MIKKLNRKTDQIQNCLDVWIDRLRGKQFVHFLHVSKTGGTAIKTALRPYLSTSGRRIFLRKHPVSIKDIPVGEKILIVFRDPAKRFESAFYSRLRKGQPRFYIEWTEHERKAFQRFKSPSSLAEALSASDPESKRAAVQAMEGIRHIRESYEQWYVDKQYFLSRHQDILAVGRQERLNQFFHWIKKRLDLDEASLPDGRKKAHKRPECFDRGLTNIAHKNLREWYAKDYDFLNFCDEHAEKINYFGVDPDESIEVDR